jgi:hypothetical protein
LLARRWLNGVAFPRCGSEVTFLEKYNRWQCYALKGGGSDRKTIVLGIRERETEKKPKRFRATLSLTGQDQYARGHSGSICPVKKLPGRVVKVKAADEIEAVERVNDFLALRTDFGRIVFAGQGGFAEFVAFRRIAGENPGPEEGFRRAWLSLVCYPLLLGRNSTSGLRKLYR